MGAGLAESNVPQNSLQVLSLSESLSLTLHSLSAPLFAMPPPPTACGASGRRPARGPASAREPVAARASAVKATVAVHSIDTKRDGRAWALEARLAARLAVPEVRRPPRALRRWQRARALDCPRKTLTCKDCRLRPARRLRRIRG